MGSLVLNGLGWTVLLLLALIVLGTVGLPIVLGIRRYQDQQKKVKIHRYKPRITTWPCPQCSPTRIGQWSREEEIYICPNCGLRFNSSGVPT